MGYTLVTTADGSQTYINQQYDEAYHSVHGAYAEALHKHVLACRIPELAKSQQQIRLLDVCFGLGYNSGVAIEQILKINPNCEIEIIGLENDAQIVEMIKDLEFPDELANYKTSHQMILHSLARAQNQIDINILIGDARETIKNLESNYFDAIFFDPFSPLKCPELWQAEFIAAVVRTAKPNSYISTYSSSRLAKDGFQAAGCSLHEGPKLNRRNGGVLAQKLC